MAGLKINMKKLSQQKALEYLRKLRLLLLGDKKTLMEEREKEGIGHGNAVGLTYKEEAKGDESGEQDKAGRRCRVLNARCSIIGTNLYISLL